MTNVSISATIVQKSFAMFGGMIPVDDHDRSLQKPRLVQLLKERIQSVINLFHCQQVVFKAGNPSDRRVVMERTMALHGDEMQIERFRQLFELIDRLEEKFPIL